MNIGYESIQFQDDVGFINELTESFETIKNTINLTIPDIVGFNYGITTATDTLELNKKISKNVIIGNEIKAIQKILLNRFNIKIKINMTNLDLDSYASVIWYDTNYAMVNNMLLNMDKMFPSSKDKLMFNITASSNERKAFKHYKKITGSLRDNQLNIDFKNAVIYGYEDTPVTINFNILGFSILNLSVKEMISILLHEIGHIFTYLEHMHHTTNNSLILLDNFKTNKFNKKHSDIDSLRLALSDVNIELKDNSPLAIIETLDVFILKTFRLDPTTKIPQVDFERLSDRFVTKFGLGDSLASALLKLDDNKINIKIDKPDTNNLNSLLYKTLKFLLEAMLVIVSALLTMIIGPIIFVIIGIYKITSFLIDVTYNLLVNIINYFLTPRKTSNEKYDNINDRIAKLKTSLILELRKQSDDKNMDISKRKLLLKNIDNIIEIYDSIDDQSSFISNSKIGLTRNEIDLNYNIENIQDRLMNNDLHYYKNKF